MRTFGPLFRFDPHPERPVPVDESAHPPVWYGGEAFETAVREVLDRGAIRAPRIVEVCVRQRVAALRLPQPTELIDLTRDAVELGADDDLGDRTVGLDYGDTRAWARALHGQGDAAGLRYHSARHRAPDGSRVGVNVCLWSSDAAPTVVSDVSAAHGGAWDRLRVALVRVGAAPQLVHGCRRCR